MPTSWLGARENASKGVSDTVTVKHDIYNKVWGKVSHHITLMLQHQRHRDNAAEWDVVRASRQEDGVALQILILLWSPGSMAQQCRVFLEAGGKGKPLMGAGISWWCHLALAFLCLALLCFPRDSRARVYGGKMGEIKSRYLQCP